MTSAPLETVRDDTNAQHVKRLPTAVSDPVVVFAAFRRGVRVDVSHAIPAAAGGCRVARSGLVRRDYDRSQRNSRSFLRIEDHRLAGGRLPRLREVPLPPSARGAEGVLLRACP